MEVLFENFELLFAGVLVLIGVAQAVIGMMVKFGLKSYALIGASSAVTIGLVFAVRYGWKYEPLQLIFMSLLAVLTAAGYWRYRNGEATQVPADDPTMTEVG